MARPEFVHLHLHSQFSLLESTVRLDPLIARVKEFQMPAVALTDKYNLFGAVAFYQNVLERGLKPILGCEIWVAPDSRFEKASGSGRPEAVYPLVLLAENEEGYRNLMQLSSAGYLQGFHRVPRVDKALLARHKGGLTALSGGAEGEINRYLFKAEAPIAQRVAGEYQEIFGKDRFYLELTDHGLSADREAVKNFLENGHSGGGRQRRALFKTRRGPFSRGLGLPGPGGSPFQPQPFFPGEPGVLPQKSRGNGPALYRNARSLEAHAGDRRKMPPDPRIRENLHAFLPGDPGGRFPFGTGTTWKCVSA